MKTKILLIALLCVSLFSVVPLVSSIEQTYCCEQTTDGAICQNAPLSKCVKVDGREPVPTSCESVSYCKLGTCYSTAEGTCTSSTSQRACEKNNGIWSDTAIEDTPQCKLGCCIMGDQASFVTQVRCKRLSALYDLETNFKSTITSEVACIASVTSEARGACVFEKDFEKTCKMTTKKECGDIEKKSATGTVKFHEGYLCTSPSLETNCAPTENTQCAENKDEVYFTDSCGNLANIYDATKVKDTQYWNKIVQKSASCGADSSNANSATCGNCDYYAGSICKNFERGKDKVRPNYGSAICRDLSCTYEGKQFQHGETWCASSKNADIASVGARAFRLVCYNGDVTAEPCADFKQEQCIQGELNGFSVAACRANQWQDCTVQTEEKDCENEEKRDCSWITDLTIKQGGRCIPQIAPGLDFWKEEGDSKTICAQADSKCTVKYKKDIFGKLTCSENCECLTDAWRAKKLEVCNALGDCGSKTNYIGVAGFDNGYKIKESKQKKDASP